MLAEGEKKRLKEIKKKRKQTNQLHSCSAGRVKKKVRKKNPRPAASAGGSASRKPESES